MKKFISALIAGTMMLGLMGCGSAASGNTQSQQTNAAPAGESQAAAVDFTFDPTNYTIEDILAQYNARDTSGSTLTITYAENQPQTYPTTMGAYYLSNYIYDATDGRINVEVYYGGTLGDETSVIEQMQFGGIGMTRVSLSPLSEFDPSLNVLQMPYLYNNADHMWAVLHSEIGDQFLAGVESAGLKGLSWYDAGARSFYSTKPLNSMADLSGLAIRVQESSLMQDLVASVGANATAMAYSEVYSSLQTGVVDGAENNWPSYYSSGHYEVAKNFLLDEHTRVPEMQMISLQIWNSLSAEDQALISEAALASAECEHALWVDFEAESEKVVTEAGCTIVRLDEAGVKTFQDAVSGLYAKYCADYTDIIEAIQAKGE